MYKEILDYFDSLAASHVDLHDECVLTHPASLNSAYKDLEKSFIDIEPLQGSFTAKPQQPTSQETRIEIGVATKFNGTNESYDSTEVGFHFALEKSMVLAKQIIAKILEDRKAGNGCVRHILDDKIVWWQSEKTAKTWATIMIGFNLKHDDTINYDDSKWQ